MKKILNFEKHFSLSNDSTDEICNENVDHLMVEVKRLQNERSLLLKESTKHQETLQEKISTLHEEYELTLKDKIEKIEKVWPLFSITKFYINFYPLISIHVHLHVF